MFVCVDESYNASLLQKLEQRLEKYYNGQASIQYYEAAQNGNEEWGPNSSHQVLLNIINEGDSVLDLGCGTGVVAQKARNKKIKYTGIDWSSTAITVAKRKLKTEAVNEIEAKFIQRSLYETELEGQSFDIVVSMFVIEHLTRPTKFIDEAIRLVRPDGVIFILCPDYRRFGRMPSLPLGGNNSLRQKLSKFEIIPAINHLLFALYWKIKTRFIGPWAIWTEPACFNGAWRPDADAVYLASRNEIVEKITRAGFVDQTDYWLSQSSVKPNNIDCLIVAKRNK
jgi:2-polyprenyl-3-methyl-5-hydroxy-6-metoxy-1,4-benzoquinol methylase